MNELKPCFQSPFATEDRAIGGLLSFIVPGLGQVYQGLRYKNLSRLAKGLFFFASLWGMFFYGMWLGKWKNVYIPHVQEQMVDENRPIQIFNNTPPTLVANLYTRLQYVGQFWIGAVAWPALWNYYMPEKPIFGQYMTSPGAVPQGQEDQRRRQLEDFERELNEMQLAPEMGKQWDIAWVYTVIAGVLNILVIFDAATGPLFFRERTPAGTDQGGAA